MLSQERKAKTSRLPSTVVATAIAAAWNAKYGAAAGTASGSNSFWGTTLTSAASTTGIIGSLNLKDAQSGSRAYGQAISFSHSYKAVTDQITYTVAGSGNPTYTFIDWIIGSDDAQLASTDNKATDVDLIISLEETLASGTAINSSNATVTLGTDNFGTPLTELITAKRKVGAQSNTTATDIYEDDPGIYTSIYGGNAGDVRFAEDASEGLVVEDGSRRAYFSRIHWLSS